MIKKQIQKFSFIRVLLSTILFTVLVSQAVFLIPAKIKEAQAQIRGSNCTGILPYTKYDFDSTRDKVQPEEAFDVQIKLTFSTAGGKTQEQVDAMAKACETQSNNFEFSLFLYTAQGWLGAGSSTDIRQTAKFFKDKTTGESGFYGKFSGITIKQIDGPDYTPPGEGGEPDPRTQYLYVYLLDKTNQSEKNVTTGRPIIYTKSVVTDDPVKPLANIPGGAISDTTTREKNRLVDYQKVLISIKGDSNGKGLRSKYRINWYDSDLIFGAVSNKANDPANGPDAIYLDWQDQQSALYSGDQFTLAAKDNTWGYTGNPYYLAANVFFNYYKDFKALPNNKLACKGTWTGTDCTGIVFRNADGSDKGTGAGGKAILPQYFSPVLKTQAWRSQIPEPKPAQKAEGGNKGEKLGEIEFAALPAIHGSTTTVTTLGITWDVIQALGVDSTVTLITGGKSSVKPFIVEVYANNTDIKTACKADPSVSEADKPKCDTDLYFAKYGFSETISQTTSSSEKASDTPAQTLYGFITRVISDIIIWLQSVIYRVFAFVVVPILNALLRVRPYEDAFVNVIYPGWLILRNLANIFFIVSLLVVGLRILFQLSASGTAVGFIRRLLIMALLVNFSLVISQGIIGIADTVQSQFLPGNTKIIEALGQKLMVEPLKNMRDEVALKDGGVFNSENSEAALADTVKPVVLLILSIAAFFSFIAIAAFLMIRLVVLWVLYMISPIAYVGFVMEETKKYASQWWSEFIKQAMLAPILVFFLNIAALMATTFSTAGKNDLFTKFNPDGSLSGDVVIGSLTILTHFIVLGFLFAGMKFALSFGGIGSKAIVDYVKKGFDNVTKRPAKWAGGVAKDAAKTQWDRNFKGGMLDPFAHRDAFKKNVDDKTKKTMEARLARKENKLTPEGMYKKPFKALKYVLSGGSIAGGIMEKEKNALDDESRILTESERQKYENEMAYNTNRLDNATEDLGALNSNRVSHSQVQTDIINELEAKEVSLAQEKAVLEQEATDFHTNGRLADEQKKRDEAALVQEDIDKLNAIRTNVETRLAASVAAGEASVAFDKDTTDEIKVVFNADDAKDKLKKEIAELEGEIKVLDDNDKLKKAFNYDPYQDMTDDKRADLKAKASKLDEEINGHYMPPSLGATNARLAREKEYEKNIAHLEGEELRLAFKKAMADNNTDLATAIGKKVAQEGDFDSLLKDYGFKNNAEDLTKFIDQKFGKLSPIVRAQVGSEISTINKKNGNLALGDAYKISEKGHIIARPLEEQLRKVNASAEKKSPDEVLKKGPNGLTYQTAKGHFINQGDINNFNSFKGKRMDNLNKMNFKLAQHLVKAQNFSGLDARIQAKITEIANKNI